MADKSVAAVEPENESTGEAYNPFQAPETSYLEETEPVNDDELMRRAYLSREASVKSVGSLYLIFGLVLSVTPVAALLTGPGRPGSNASMLAVPIGIGALFVCTATGVWRLRKWARCIACSISIVGLLVGFPCGLLINVYILYLLFSSSGSMVFSEEYEQIIERTPHIRFRSSRLVLGILMILAPLVGFGLMMAFGLLPKNLIHVL